VSAHSPVSSASITGAITPPDWATFTITGHFKCTENTGYYQVLTMLSNGGYGTNYYQTYLDDNTTEIYNLLSLDCNFVNGGNVVHGNPITYGQWHTMVMTHREADSVGYNSVWLDGVHHPGLPLNVDDDPASGTLTFFSDLEGTPAWFKGRLASFKFFRGIEMTQAEANLELAQVQTVDTTHIVANYPLHNNANDISGNGFHLTPTGTIVWDTVDTPGIPDVASGDIFRRFNRLGRKPRRHLLGL